MRPILKWAGGKGRQVALLSEGLPVGVNTYHEPFVGGGAMFFHLFDKQNPSCIALNMEAPDPAAVLSDGCAPLVVTYQAVRDEVSEVIDRLRSMQGAYATCSDPRRYYFEARTRLNDLVVCEALGGKSNGPELTTLFIFINRAGFNGLWRVNKAGHCNVPWGQDQSVRVLFEAELRAASEALQCVEIAHADFRASMPRVGAGDLCYLDPPYAQLKATSFTGYGAGGFTEQDQRDLAQLAGEAVERGAKVVVSNADVPLVRELYPHHHWRATQVRAPRAINSNGAGRGSVGELIMRSW